MNKDLHSKLKLYSGLASAAILSASNADAAVIHSSINYTGGYESSGIDIDGDGNTDVYFFATSTYTGTASGFEYVWGYMGVYGYGGFASGASFVTNSTPLNSGSYINGSNYFSYGFKTMVYGYQFTSFPSYGNNLLSNSFEGSGDKYVGIRFKIGGNTHYGWMRFTNIAFNGSSWTLVDVAYECTPGVGITIGDTGTQATAPTLSSSTLNTCNSGDAVNLSVTGGNLNDADDWVWYQGSVSGSQLGTGISLSQNPTSTTTYVVRAESCGIAYGPTSSITVNVGDNTAPVANVASLPTLTNQCSITSLTAPTATDNCAGTVTATHNKTLPITASTTITWTYNDGNGNTSTQNQTVTINDNTAPVPNVATLPVINASCEVTSLTAPTATDNCAGTITGTHNKTLPITASTTITWTYNDGKGNTSTQTQSVVIDDNTPPVPDNASLSPLNATCEITSLTTPTGTDNCGGIVTVTHDQTLPITASTTITWTYSDDQANTVTQTQSVVITDVSAPVADNSSLTDVDSCDPIASVGELTAPTATDDVSGSLTATTNATFPISAPTTITWTYEDGCGKTTTQTQNINITVVDAGITSTTTTLSSDETNSTATYQWVDCDNGNANISGETSKDFTPSASGNYAVKVTIGSCSVTSSCVSFSKLASIDDVEVNNVNLHPNPASDFIVVELDKVYNDTKMEIYDVTGKVVRKSDISGNKTIVSTIDLAPGVYLIKITNSVESHTVRFVKK